MNTKRLVFPLAAELVFILAIHMKFLQIHALYYYLVFFLAVLIWFRKDLSAAACKKVFSREAGFRAGRFWLAFLLTALGLTAAYFATEKLPDILFPVSDKGMIQTVTRGWTDMVIYIITILFLEPISEELFYRKALIGFGDKGILIFTSVLSLILVSFLHATGPIGIVCTMLTALPLLICYIRTKNVYLTILLHILFNMITNLPDIIYVVARMVLS